jgi:hypothetical protein
MFALDRCHYYIFASVTIRHNHHWLAVHSDDLTDCVLSFWDEYKLRHGIVSFGVDDVLIVQGFCVLSSPVTRLFSKVLGTVRLRGVYPWLALYESTAADTNHFSAIRYAIA